MGIFRFFYNPFWHPSPFHDLSESGVVHYLTGGGGE